MNTLNNTNNSNSHTEPIEAVLKKLIQSQEEGDLNAFSSCFARDKNTINIGTDLDEIWHGWDDFYEWMKYAIANKPDYKITDINTMVFLSNSNDVAWYSQLLDTCFETKGEPFRIEGFRHTGVLEKRDGKWLIVQSHISVPDYSISDKYLIDNE